MKDQKGKVKGWWRSSEGGHSPWKPHKQRKVKRWRGLCHKGFEVMFSTGLFYGICFTQTSAIQQFWSFTQSLFYTWYNHSVFPAEYHNIETVASHSDPSQQFSYLIYGYSQPREWIFSRVQTATNRHPQTFLYPKEG